jgi:hypothetical protein
MTSSICCSGNKVSAESEYAVDHRSTKSARLASPELPSSRWQIRGVRRRRQTESLIARLTDAGRALALPDELDRGRRDRGGVALR